MQSQPEVLEIHRDLPPYIQIAAAIRTDITSGQIPPESKLASENEMAEAFGVARATVRRALAVLVQEGLVYSRRAVGYFVAPPRVDQDLDQLFGFSEFMQDQGFKPGSKLLVAEIQRISALRSPLLRHLNLRVGEAVVFLRRLRFANNEPLVIAGTYLPERLFPGFLEQDIKNRSVYEIMEHEYGLKPDEAVQTFQSVQLDPQEADLLGQTAGEPALLIERIGYAGDVPVEYARDFYRGDRTKFRVRLAENRSRRELGLTFPSSRSDRSSNGQDSIR